MPIKRLPYYPLLSINKKILAYHLMTPTTANSISLVDNIKYAA